MIQFLNLILLNVSIQNVCLYFIYLRSYTYKLNNSNIPNNNIITGSGKNQLIIYISLILFFSRFQF